MVLIVAEVPVAVYDPFPVAHWNAAVRRVVRRRMPLATAMLFGLFTKQSSRVPKLAVLLVSTAQRLGLRLVPSKLATQEQCHAVPSALRTTVVPQLGEIVVAAVPAGASDTAIASASTAAMPRAAALRVNSLLVICFPTSCRGPARGAGDPSRRTRATYPARSGVSGV